MCWYWKYEKRGWWGGWWPLNPAAVCRHPIMTTLSMQICCSLLFCMGIGQRLVCVQCQLNNVFQQKARRMACEPASLNEKAMIVHPCAGIGSTKRPMPPLGERRGGGGATRRRCYAATGMCLCLHNRPKVAPKIPVSKCDTK